jgi:hypothetical protein
MVPGELQRFLHAEDSRWHTAEIVPDIMPQKAISGIWHPP